MKSLRILLENNKQLTSYKKFMFKIPQDKIINKKFIIFLVMFLVLISVFLMIKLIINTIIKMKVHKLEEVKIYKYDNHHTPQESIQL
jgi:hypothetical protein